MVQASANEREIVFAEEAFVVDAQSLLYDLMEDKGISRSQLAMAMGVSRARVSQILSDECKNFTVRLFARAMHALGEQPQVSCGWAEEKAASDAKAERQRSVTASSNIHELWTDMARPEEAESPCSDGDIRINGLLRRQAELVGIAA